MALETMLNKLPFFLDCSTELLRLSWKMMLPTQRNYINEFSNRSLDICGEIASSTNHHTVMCVCVYWLSSDISISGHIIPRKHIYRNTLAANFVFFDLVANSATTIYRPS